MTRDRALLGALVGIVLLLGAGYAVRVPVWLAPDEPAHYNYAAQVAADGCCPIIAAGDWDQAYLAQLTGSDFAPADRDRLDSVQYEDHQPPLYYLLLGAVYPVAGGNPLALRLLTVVIGAGIVVCAWLTGRALLPDRPGVALGAAALVGLVPQHLHIIGSINNDALAGLIIGLTLWRLVAAVLRPGGVTPGAAWTLGVLAGIGLLTKVSTLFLVGLVPVGIVGAWWIARGSGRQLALTLAAFAVPAALIAGVWAARNLGVYGFPDVFGLRAHDAVVVGQPRTAEAIAALGVGGYARALLTTTFHSFWGQFGWMELALPSWAYAAIGGFLAIGGVGLLVGLVQPTPDPENGRRARGRLAWGLLGLTLLLALAQYAYYNTAFQQFQGRYIYPGLIPLALLIVAGLDTLWRLAARRIGLSGLLVSHGAAGVVLWLVLLNVFILWRVIPGLTV